LALAFKLDPATTDILLWTSRAFLAGLTGQCLLEIAVRSFYSRQEAIPPLITAGINLGVYILIGSLLYQSLGAPGIGLADAVAFTSQALLLLFLLNRRLTSRVTPGGSLARAIAAGLAAGIAAWLIIAISGERLAGLLGSLAGMALGAAVAVPIVWRELRVLARL
jgi:putative peptidoglycan lipid II flippase